MRLCFCNFCVDTTAYNLWNAFFRQTENEKGFFFRMFQRQLPYFACFWFSAIQMLWLTTERVESLLSKRLSIQTECLSISRVSPFILSREISYLVVWHSNFLLVSLRCFPLKLHVRLQASGVPSETRIFENLRTNWDVEEHHSFHAKYFVLHFEIRIICFCLVAFDFLKDHRWDCHHPVSTQNWTISGVSEETRVSHIAVLPWTVLDFWF